MDVFTRFKFLHPFVKVGMGIGFTDEDEMKAVEQGAAAEGLVGVEVVAQEGVVSCVVEGAVVLQPPFGGIVFRRTLFTEIWACPSWGTMNSGRSSIECFSFAPIGKVREALAKLPDELIETFETHVQSLRWKSAPRG